MRVLGVDPGARGALALLVDGRLERVEDMPFLMVHRGKSDKAEVDGYSLVRLLYDFAIDVGVVELVGGMTGQSASSAFNFGRAAGAPEYQLQALGIRMERVSPVRWKKALGLKTGKDDGRAMAMRLWPAQAHRFKRVMDHDRADAALIAHWFSLQHGVANVFA